MYAECFGVQIPLKDGVLVIMEQAQGIANTPAEAFVGTGKVTGRGDELALAGRLHKLAECLEEKHMDRVASQVSAYARELVAKQLNEFDGFDR